jgi:GT2 family glycosyltransferase
MQSRLSAYGPGSAEAPAAPGAERNIPHAFGMLSIVTAVFNQLEMNKLFLERLQRFTALPHEVIIIDNNSTDGSGDYFRTKGATVIANDGNYSYPHCQNQGIAAARGDILAFLNNDIIVSPSWDLRLLKVMEWNQLDVATPCGVERLEANTATRYYRKKWSLVRRVARWFRPESRRLRLMHRWMYGDWEGFADRRWRSFEYCVREGFVGSSVMMTRRALDKVGLWDERIQAGDFDLYLRTKIRSLRKGDIRPVHVSLGVFNHHYIRQTAKAPRPAFKDQSNLLPLQQKWGHTAKDLLSYIS